MANTENATVETAVETPKLAKSATITLRAGESVMQLVAERTADGARTYVLMTDAATKKTTRGMSAIHATFEAAKAHCEENATKAVAAGWTRKVRAAMFQPKPDAFSTIPAPPTAPASTKTTKKEKR